MNALLVKVDEAMTMLALSEKKVRDLANDGVLEKKYVGKGTRNYRITVASIEDYVSSLSSDPLPVGEGR